MFVDLASISAGENDIDVDRVACFHDAVQGYTSLLHKLDRSAGFQVFMFHVRELWKALENDPHLPSKLASLISGSAKHRLAKLGAHLGRLSHPCVRQVLLPTWKGCLRTVFFIRGNAFSISYVRQ